MTAPKVLALCLAVGTLLAARGLCAWLVWQATGLLL